MEGMDGTNPGNSVRGDYTSKPFEVRHYQTGFAAEKDPCQNQQCTCSDASLQLGVCHSGAVE